mmetsp:Transcript_2601/g.4199  ORF Transcript_2601/g.4199 Transcript_2601/m.4199 type:complete len:173 (-) Transcript_2601:85-603(-)
MTDVESRQSAGVRLNNPYATGQPIPIRPRWHPLNVLQRGMWMLISVYVLHRMDTYTIVMTSPDVSHEWFKVGLAASIALLLVKAYVEMYTGRLQKKEVSYKTMPQSTHAAILLLCLSGLSFHLALWPVYGGKAMFIMFAVGIFLMNFCLMFPTIVQNIVAFAVLTFFLQVYK